ncbi:hypothetical protein LSAT2_010116, partial [Lamellibrachia satsuma]
LYHSVEDFPEMLNWVQVRALSRPVQDLYTRVLQVITHSPRFVARGIVLLEDKCLPLTIKSPCRGKHLVSEHSDVLVLPHGTYTKVELADPTAGHAPPNHQGSPSMLNCGDNALWAKPFPLSLLTKTRFAPQKS